MPTVGVIKPSTRPGRAEELVAMLPKEIELAHGGANIANGTIEELRRSFVDFEQQVAEMADLRVDLIHPAGVPFLMIGREGEHAMVSKWEQRHGIPVFTTGISQVNVLKALGVKRLVMASYFPAESNQYFAKYVEEAGFDVLANTGFDVDFKEVPKVEASVLRAFFDKLYLPHRGKAEALLLIGPAWRATLGMIEELEDAYGISVIHHVPSQSWEIQTRLGFRQSFDGYGRVMREMPQ